MLSLVPIALQHAPAVQALAVDPRVAATTNVPHPYPVDGAVTWIRFTTAQRELGREMNFAILDGGTLVGVCGVISIEAGVGEVGYWIGVPYWGRGYASAAVAGLLRMAFEDRALERLKSSCLVRNAPSLRVLDKAGFRRVGFGMLPGEKWTAEDRCVLFELTREEWLIRR